jgi:flagellar biosynthetic protein FliR
MAGFQMGFAIANVMDPSSNLQIPLLSQFLNLFALIIFLGLNMHYYFLEALAEAFEVIPPFGASFHQWLFPFMMKLVEAMYIIAIKIGAPVTVAMLLTSVALGLIARTVPQMQIFIVAMPLKIILGLIFLGLSLPFCATFLQGAFRDLGNTIFTMVHLLK